MVVFFVGEVGVWGNDAGIIGINAHGVVGVKELSDTIVGDLGFAITPSIGTLRAIEKMEHAITKVLFGEPTFGSVGAVIGFG